MTKRMKTPESLITKIWLTINRASQKFNYEEVKQKQKKAQNFSKIDKS